MIKIFVFSVPFSSFFPTNTWVNVNVCGTAAPWWMERIWVLGDSVLQHLVALETCPVSTWQGLVLLTVTVYVCGRHSSSWPLWSSLANAASPQLSRVSEIPPHSAPSSLWWTLSQAQSSQLHCPLLPLWAAGLSAPHPYHAQPKNGQERQLSGHAFFLSDDTIPPSLLWCDLLLVDRLIPKCDRVNQDKRSPLFSVFPHFWGPYLVSSLSSLIVSYLISSLLISYFSNFLQSPRNRKKK